MQAAGAQIVRGDFDDLESAVRLMAGADVAFLVGIPWGKNGIDAETRQGLALVAAAQACGVRQLIYTSIASGDQKTGIPFFDSKQPIERAVVDSGIPYTILGPVFFMENVYGRLLSEYIPKGIVAMPLPPDRPLQQVAVRDIGAFVASIVSRPAQYASRRIDIASDELTGEQMALALADATGRPFRYRQLDLAELKVAIPGYGQMFEFLAKYGYRADIAALRAEAPEVGWHRYADWARATTLAVRPQLDCAGAESKLKPCAR